MKLLGATLSWQAVLWAIAGVALVIAPGWVTEVLFDQPPVEDAWLRAFGVASVCLAAQMVLVRRKLEELWWWSWTFVLLELGTAVVFAATALLGAPEGAPTWPWRSLALLNAALGALEVIGLAKSGTERPAA
ncbi:MAG TPA: hypothetical protein VFA08_04445 [Actinomycetota bacterium]|nr:hypothetical protein [Actinomycetota bacterium]